jgi:hypothetical protein
MGSHCNDKRAQVDKDNGSSCVGVEHSEIDTGKFYPEQKAHHESMEEPDVRMK